MNLQKIEQLIKKYEEGDTSVDEEKLLKDFFLNDDVPLHLKSYINLFAFIDDSQKEELLDENFDKKILDAIGGDVVIPISTRKRKLYTIVSIAAGIALLIGVYFQFNSNVIQISDTYDDPRLAYAETKKILLMVSGNLNSGVSELEKVSEFNTGLEKLNNFSEFDAGIKSLEKISIFDKSKKIITTKN